MELSKLDFGRLQRGLELLTLGNPKTMKGLAQNYLTAILHLAPAWSSGRNVCAFHSDECAEDCLSYSGRGAMKKVQDARVRRTKEYFDERPKFIAKLHADIWLVVQYAQRVGLTPAIRLNGTSDILWETWQIPQSFPSVQFYDYTKWAVRKKVPPNYHLTFSFSGTNLKATYNWLTGGGNVAVPFLVEVPKTWLGWPTIDGDSHDLRFLDPTGGKVVALKAKGPLRRHPESAFLGENHDL